MALEDDTKKPASNRQTVWNRYFLLVIFTLSIALTVSYFLNGNALRDWWDLVGIPSKEEAGNEPPLTLQLRWCKYFQSSEMAAAFAGFILDYCGPKLTHTLGQLMMTGALVVMYFGHIGIGLIVAGSTTQLTLTSVMCIANLFPEAKNLVMAILSAACDIAQFLLPITFSIHKRCSSLTYHNLLLILASIALCAAVVSFIFLPIKAFDDQAAGKDVTGETSPLVPKDSSTAETLTEEIAEKAQLPYWNMSAWQQLTSLPFLVFLPAWCQLVIRMNCFLDSNTAIIKSYGAPPSMNETFGYIMPCSFIPCIFVGLLADAKGILFAAQVVNACAIVVNALSLIPCLWLQWITIIIFTIVKSAVFTIMFAFVAEVFGFKNFGIVSVLCSAVGGLCNQTIGYLFVLWAEEPRSWFWPTVTFLVMGIVAQFLFIYLSYLIRMPPEVCARVEDTLHRERLTQVYGFTGPGRVSTRSIVLDGCRDFKRISGRHTTAAATDAAC